MDTLHKTWIIGFDIDGTITDDNTEGNIWDTELKMFFGCARQNTSYDFRDAFGITLEQIECFYDHRAVWIYSTVPIKKGVKPVIDELKRLGATIYLVTARSEEHRDVTANYLITNGISYDGLYFTEDKTKTCLSLGVELFVDDRYEICRSLTDAGIPSLLMNAFHNETRDFEPRANDWIDVRNFLMTRITAV